MSDANFLTKLPRPFFALAPMDDVTDTVFRQIVADCAPPDLFFTEFVNVDGLQSPGRSKLLKKLQFTAKERPLIVQLWGLKPENFYKTAKEMVEMGFDGIDINMGCPVKTVIKNGACAALMNNRALADEIIDAVREGVSSVKSNFPVSVKTRVGFTTVDESWIDFLLNKKLDLLSIHGRTAKQMSKTPADWELIGRVREMRDSMFPVQPLALGLDGVQGENEQRSKPYKGYGERVAEFSTPRSAKSASGATSSTGRQADSAQSPQTLIVGNGDVLNLEQARELAEKHQLDGIMIGRGIFHDPFLFANPPAGGSPWQQMCKDERLALFAKHISLFAKTWSASRRSEYRFEALKKFAKVYINGFEGASDLRLQFMDAANTKQALHILTRQ